MAIETVLAVVVILMSVLTFIFLLINISYLVKIKRAVNGNGYEPRGYEREYERPEPKRKIREDVEEESGEINMDKSYSKRELKEAIEREQAKLNQAKKVLKNWR